MGHKFNRYYKTSQNAQKAAMAEYGLLTYMTKDSTYYKVSIDFEDWCVVVRWTSNYGQVEGHDYLIEEGRYYYGR